MIIVKEKKRILLKKQGVYDIMSVSEPEACLHGYGERRMSVMIAAKAASSTEGANHEIMSVSLFTCSSGAANGDHDSCKSSVKHRRCES